jgi:hypothetical protein
VPPERPIRPMVSKGIQIIFEIRIVSPLPANSHANKGNNWI